MSLALDFKRQFLGISNLWSRGLKKFFFKKIENFENKGIIERCVSCFLVYTFYGSLFCPFFKKKVFMGWRFRFEYGMNQKKPLHTTDIGNEQNKAQEIGKKAMVRFGETWKHKEQDESDNGHKNKVDGLVEKWLVFFEKNLNKIANLDQKTCKYKIRIKLITQNQGSQAQQSQVIQALQQ